MLQDLLDGDEIDLKDSNEIAWFTTKLEQAYYSAVQTGRDATFNRQYLIRKIIAWKLPYLKRSWSQKVYQASCEGREIKEFKEFLDFLNYYEDLARWMIDDGCDDLCKFFMDEDSCESMDED